MHRIILAVCFVALATSQQDHKGQQDLKGQQGQEVPKGEVDPCEKYVSITDEKRSLKHKATVEEPKICDYNINESVWYRFQTPPPQRIHDQCVTDARCGTDEPIYVNGAHPTAADPGPKEVEVCSSNGTECCGKWREKIQVKFCLDPEEGDNNFYVYMLKKAPRCDMAYCAGDGDIICEKGTAWNPNSKTCTQPHPIIDEPVFEGPISVKKTLVDTQRYVDFYFTCKIKWMNPDALKKGERFEVVFTFDGDEVTSVPPKITNGTNLNVRLWSKEIKGHVGKKVGCQVRTYWKALEIWRTIYIVSRRTYFVGITYSTSNDPGSFTSPRIEIDEKSPPLTLYFQATVPISCPEATSTKSCKVTVTMADIEDKDGLGVLDCFIIFNGLDSETILPAQMIKALTTPGATKRTSVLRFQPVKTNPDFFWYQYQLPAIPITIKDSSTSGICHSGGDPHITTFDGRYYNVYTEGDYLLAKSTERNFEVHVRHHKYGSVATCNCAVAVREGNNVLGINFCGGPNSYPTAITYLKDNNVPGATITLSGDIYTITMPCGAYVRADYFRGWINSILYIYVYLNSEDKGKTSGLCGVWNGNSGDDTVPKGSTTNDAREFPTTFSDSYRLKPEESYLNGHVKPIQCLDIEKIVPNICTCDEKRALTCASPNAIATTYVSQFIENCNKDQITKSRRRRDADSTAEVQSRVNDMIITEADIPLPVVDEEHGVNFTSSWPTASGITEQQAKSHCQSKMVESPIYQMCKDKIAADTTTAIVTSCVEDAQAMDNLTASSSFTATQFQRLCVHKLEISVVSDGSSTPTAEETYLAKVASMICPNQCNGNGNCKNGICVCNTGFIGEDCFVNLANPPHLESFRKGVKCDFRSSYCQEISIFASNFFVSERFRCKITAVDHATDFALRGSVLSNGEVMCKLPEVYKFTDEKAEGQGPSKVKAAPFYRWNITITNDGGSYSNSLQLTVYDSKCQEFLPDGTITKKADTCVIDGRCYGSEKCLPTIKP